jgi:hypothetical protein
MANRTRYYPYDIVEYIRSIDPLLAFLWGLILYATFICYGGIFRDRLLFERGDIIAELLEEPDSYRQETLLDMCFWQLKTPPFDSNEKAFSHFEKKLPMLKNVCYLGKSKG